MLHGDFALVPACLMAGLAYLWRDQLGQQGVVLGLVAAVFAVHMIGLRLSWRVWRPVPEPARPAWDLPTVPLQRLPQAPQPAGPPTIFPQGPLRRVPAARTAPESTASSRHPLPLPPQEQPLSSAPDAVGGQRRERRAEYAAGPAEAETVLLPAITS